MKAAGEGRGSWSCMLQASGAGLQGKKARESYTESSDSKKQSGLILNLLQPWGLLDGKGLSYNMKELQGMQNMGERHKFQLRDWVKESTLMKDYRPGFLDYGNSRQQGGSVDWVRGQEENRWWSSSAGCYNIIAYVYNIRRRWWHPTPVLLPGKSHGQRSLVGCSPWRR